MLFAGMFCILQSADTAVKSTAPAEISSQSAAVRQKLSQLEMEIQHFREENATVTRLRKEQEQVCSSVGI